MKCIFCQQPSSDSTSVEHIIPESLGNKVFILSRGWVCDKCNNYFAVKIEQPLLNMPFFNQHRHDLSVPSKRGRIPSKKGFLLDTDTSSVLFHKTPKEGETIDIERNILEKILADGIIELPVITIKFGAPTSNSLLSKFLGKIGIELLAYDANHCSYDESYYNQESLNNIKRYVRNGEKNQLWQYTIRQLYDPDGGFKDATGYLKVICSWKFIITSNQQLLFQFLYVGTEFTIDMLNPSTQYIHQWLVENNGRSVVLESLLKQYNS